ncbi:MAG: Chromate transporter [Firmicutes bacterium]|nr:Chromate transporter [Bacillota bacterium]
MDLYIDILITFLKIGLVGFGGGYAIIPIIESEAALHGWLDVKQLTNIIAIAAMAPGPIAANCATIIGFKLSSLEGAVVACIGITLPSLFIILFLGKLFLKFQQHALVKAIFYGLRATIIGTIVYAAIKFAVSNGIIGGANGIDVKSVLVLLVSFVLLIKTKINPIYLIILAGMVGIFIF